MTRPIQAEPLDSLMAGDAPHAVLDVRPREDYVAEQIFGSTTVPIDELADRLPALVPVRSLPTIFVDADDRGGRVAAGEAKDAGYRDARWLAGGIAANWIYLLLR